MTGFDRCQHRLILRVEPLVAPAARAGVRDHVTIVAIPILVWLIDLPEVGQKRSQHAARLENPVARSVNFRNLAPPENAADVACLEKPTAYCRI